MTLERQKYLEPFIVAQNQGKIIEIKLGEYLSWQEIKTPVISVGEDADYIKYRIKPEPREFWLVPFFPSTSSETKGKIQYRQVDNPDEWGKCIKVREVID